MGKRVMDLTGQRYGRLTVIGRGEDHVFPSGQRLPRWRCVCDCGAAATALGQDLRRGDTQSCGCLNRQRVAERNRLRTGAAHPRWQGDAITYDAAHKRIRRAKGKASDHPCADCGERAERMEWSYVGACSKEQRHPKYGAYCAGAHLACYEPRCRECHAQYDAALRADRDALAGVGA